MAFDVGTFEVLDAEALEVDDALAVDIDVFPLVVLVALALDEDELLALVEEFPFDVTEEFELEDDELLAVDVVVVLLEGVEAGADEFEFVVVGS